MLEPMRYRNSDEELLDEIVQELLTDNRTNGNGKMTHEMAISTAERILKTWWSFTRMKMRKVISDLQSVIRRNVSRWMIEVVSDCLPDTDETERNDIIAMALMIMLIRYRSNFLSLMRYWWVDPKPYIEAYIDAKH